MPWEREGDEDLETEKQTNGQTEQDRLSGPPKARSLRLFWAAGQL